MPSYMYILECADGSFYTGSTKNLERRLWQHQNGEGANYTKKRLPVKLAFCEPYDRVEDAFQREKQVQGWSRQKKKALIEQNYDKLIEFSRNYTQYGKNGELMLIDPVAEAEVELVETEATATASTGSASAISETFPELAEGNRASTGSTSVDQVPFRYTVAQIIEVLKSMPQNLPVLISGYETGFENSYPVEIVKLKHEPENAYYDGEFQITEDEDKDMFLAVVLRRMVRE